MPKNLQRALGNYADSNMKQKMIALLQPCRQMLAWGPWPEEV